MQRLGPGVKGWCHRRAAVAPLGARDDRGSDIGHLTHTHHNLIAAEFRRRFFAIASIWEMIGRPNFERCAR